MKREKDPEKENRLLESAFKLFTEKGLKATSIQGIVDESNVAKGTFYLYFKDKYELRDILIEKKSKKLFMDAVNELRKNYIQSLDDQIIFIVNHIINELSKNTILLKFISKNLSWGVYSKTVNKLYQNSESEEESVYSLFLKGIKEQNIKLKNPDVTLYMIIELVSSSCFNSILYNEPLPIEEYKPFLYDAIRKLMHE
ncbi:MAG: TetR/AcrR family transcriptional regulator [Clostridia bacterium]|nr:TetR/AcrR family transcriptional regulator [Clostridia bacterium]